MEGPPEVPEDIASCLGALSEWGVTPETLIRSSPPTAEEVNLLQKAATPVHEYVKSLWVEDEWETAWFVNPPVRSPSRFSPISRLTAALFSDCKVFQAWHIFTFSRNGNELTKNTRHI